MKTSISVNSSPYLTKPLRTIEQVKADQESKKHQRETDEIARGKVSESNLKKLSLEN